MKRYLETEEIKSLIDSIYSNDSFQESVDTINQTYNIKLSRYKVEIAESWNYVSEKTVQILVLSFDNGTVEMMYLLQDQKEIITFTSVKNQEILVA